MPFKPEFILLEGLSGYHMLPWGQLQDIVNEQEGVPMGDNLLDLLLCHEHFFHVFVSFCPHGANISRRGYIAALAIR